MVNPGAPGPAAFRVQPAPSRATTVAVEGRLATRARAPRPVATTLASILADGLALAPGFGAFGALGVRTASALALAAGLLAWVAIRLLETKRRGRDVEALRERAERSRALARRLVEVEEDERRRLALELHEGIGQAVATIALNLQLLGPDVDPERRSLVEDSLAIARETIGRVRDIALDLRPSMLDDLGPAAALRWLVRRQCDRAGLEGHCRAVSSGPPVPRHVATACYRIARDVLGQVVRHGRARNVWVELVREADGVLLVIRDDGAGLDSAQVGPRAARDSGPGAVGIRERAELLGGRVDVASGPDHGTTVRAWIPVDPSD